MNNVVPFRHFETRRIQANLTREELCRRVGISLRAYYFFLAGERKPRRETIVAIERALSEEDKRQDREKTARRMIVALHRSVMAILAVEWHLGRKRVLETDFDRQRPTDMAWLRAARVRALATYVVVVELGVRMADLAEAIGVSKTAVSKVVGKLEDRRDKEEMRASGRRPLSRRIMFLRAILVR